MSGFASSIIVSGRVFEPTKPVEQPEAAGRVGRVLGVIAAVVMPFAAPAIWGAIAGSTAIGASLSGAMTGIFGAGLTNVIGSAAVGAIANAGIAYASGARGGDVWRAAGAGALQGGMGGLARVGGIGALTKGPIGAPTVGAVGSGVSAGTTVGLNTISGSIGATTGAAAGAQSTGIMGQISNIFSGDGINRIGSALINAIVNNDSQDRIDALVAQQREALADLSAQEQAAYAQRMQAAQQLLAQADRNDPSWMARIRMADVAGMEANQFRQTMRNIATTQGGSLDQGQRKAYERSASLHTARSKALAWGQGWGEGERNQASIRAQGAGLLTGPNYGPWQAETELLLGQARARQQNNRSTAGGFIGAFGERNYSPSTSPDPSSQQNNQDDDDAFYSGFNFGRG